MTIPKCKIKSSKKELAQKQQRLGNVEEEIEEIKDRLCSLEEERDDLEKEIEDLEECLADAEAEEEIDLNKTMIAKYNSRPATEKPLSTWLN